MQGDVQGALEPLSRAARSEASSSDANTNSEDDDSPDDSLPILHVQACTAHVIRCKHGLGELISRLRLQCSR